jgi:hypothetical protein
VPDVVFESWSLEIQQQEQMQRGQPGVSLSQVLVSSTVLGAHLSLSMPQAHTYMRQPSSAAPRPLLPFMMCCSF